MQDSPSDRGNGIGGFTVFRRDVDPEFLVAVPDALPVPTILASGWEFLYAISTSDPLPSAFDVNAAKAAISRDGYYVFAFDEEPDAPELGLRANSVSQTR